MATTQLDICNRAIQKIGGLKLVDLAGTDVYTVAVNRAFTDALEFELRAHNWNFAIRRTSLSAPYLTITGISLASEAVLSYTGTDPADGDRVYIEDVVGTTEVNNHYYAVDYISAGSLKLRDPDTLAYIDSSAYTAWSSGGTATVVPPYGWNRKFALPSNCIRVVEIDGMEGTRAIAGGFGYGTDFTIENGFILCNDSGPLFIRYITSDIVNYIPISAWDSMFKEVMACRLALEISTEVKQNDANWQKLKNEYAYAISQAKAGDSIETPSEVKHEDDWILSRL